MMHLEKGARTTTYNPWHWGWQSRWPFPHAGKCCSSAPAYDPFFFFPHTIDSLFLAGVCLLYLRQGALHSSILLVAFLRLKRTVNVHGGVVFEAVFSASEEILDELKV
jgi:hypothetical protein